VAKMSKAEAGRLGGRATVARYGRRHMSEIGARGFAMYAFRYHNNNYEKAAFALQKAIPGFEAFPARSWAGDIPEELEGITIRKLCGICARELVSCSCCPF
jgi:hypothetical protein